MAKALFYGKYGNKNLRKLTTMYGDETFKNRLFFFKGFIHTAKYLDLKAGAGPEFLNNPDLPKNISAVFKPGN